jgi:adenylate cyclase
MTASGNQDPLPLQATGEAPASAGLVLVVDDQPSNVALMTDLLSIHGFEVESAEDGVSALAAIERRRPDVVLLDIVMPGLSGLEVCRRLRADGRHSSLPIVLVTSQDPDQERIRGLEAGADDFLARPVSGAELLARVRSLVRVKRLFDRTEAQAAELARLNGNLQALVDGKVAEVERLSKLKRFLSPALARRILEGGASDPLISHRRDIAVVFFDLRNFTAFSERSEPEDVMTVLRELHHVIGTQTQRFDATIERFVGDGVMVFFNDPEPIEAPCEVAADFALAVLRECRQAIARWRKNEFGIDLAGGLAYGYASLGAVGFSDRIDYSAIGTVANVAARLCAEAKGGELLVTTRFATQLPPRLRTESAGVLTLKGLRDPVEVHRLLDQQGPRAAA